MQPDSDQQVPQSQVHGARLHTPICRALLPNSIYDILSGRWHLKSPSTMINYIYIYNYVQNRAPLFLHNWEPWKNIDLTNF